MCRRVIADVVDRKLRRGVALAVGAAGVGLSLAACDPYVTVTGVVREPSGAPLPEVVVTLQTNGREPDRSTTGVDGSFNVGIVGADPRRTHISFRKDGFRQVDQVVGEEESRAMDVTLLPN
jgi:hypothetical protein